MPSQGLLLYSNFLNLLAYGDGIRPEIMVAVLLILCEAGAKISVDVIETGKLVYDKKWSNGISPSGWKSIERTKVLPKSPTTTPQGWWII
uniref:Uncharacterized protein n=1 Tax=Onchocerca volvulus TaxID=6282 RepID=A0A8R1XYR1_ONCVO